MTGSGPLPETSTGAPPVPGRRAGVGLQSMTVPERQVLRLLGRGLSDSQIAARLGVSEVVAASLVRRVVRSLGLRDRARAAVFAHESGFLAGSGAPPAAVRALLGAPSAGGRDDAQDAVVPIARSAAAVPVARE